MPRPSRSMGSKIPRRANPVLLDGSAPWGYDGSLSSGRIYFIYDPHKRVSCDECSFPFRDSRNQSASLPSFRYSVDGTRRIRVWSALWVVELEREKTTFYRGPYRSIHLFVLRMIDHKSCSLIFFVLLSFKLRWFSIQGWEDWNMAL